MSATNILLKKPGPCALLQDLGRIGQQTEGFSPGGAVDEHAFLWANKLLGNAPQSACLEITLGPCIIEFNAPTRCCITGAADTLFLNGKPIPSWQSFNVPEKSELKINLPQNGMRSYLAIVGGFHNDSSFESASMVMREKTGPFHGMPLKENTALAISTSPASNINASRSERIPRKFIPTYRNTVTCKIAEVCNPNEPAQSHARFEQLLKETFTLHWDSNRMAVKFSEAIQGQEKSAPRFSQGTCFGAIQLPPDGRPIILLKDRQTIGGYPHIATLDARDAFLLSQCRPGSKIRFIADNFMDQHRRLSEFYSFFGV